MNNFDKFVDVNKDTATLSVDKRKLLNLKMFSVRYDIWLSHSTVCFQIEITIFMLGVNC